MSMRLLLLIAIMCFVACDKPGIEMSKYENVDYELQCIWNQAPHCAFTSIIEYDGRFYCCFREANTHIPYPGGGYGVIRILESLDGDNWYSACVIGDFNYDLRDPHMSITPDNRLMIICGCSVLDQFSALNVRPSKVCFFSSSQSISMAQYEEHYVNIDGNQDYSSYWLWKTTWHDGIVYGCAYQNGNFPILVKSFDGINYTVITELPMFGSEADIDFIADDMVIVCRPINNADQGFVGTSSPPYIDWSYKQTDCMIHCPDILSISGVGLYVAGRSDYGTTIFRIEENIIHPVKYLPSDGDSGYPGMLYDKYNDELLVSYYTTPSTTQIYLAKFLVSDIL